ncbi:unnamed protein product [Toxocara canis]|uniref:MFS_1_like domain-containing protein n=1 Tax=Toxocara canis TaxID=6265 RepID=A0A183UGE0_TOXCA|nr:unnamed protein product [Toxocara canis]
MQLSVAEKNEERRQFGMEQLRNHQLITTRFLLHAFTHSAVTVYLPYAMVKLRKRIVFPLVTRLCAALAGASEAIAERGNLERSMLLAGWLAGWLDGWTLLGAAAMGEAAVPSGEKRYCAFAANIRAVVIAVMAIRASFSRTTCGFKRNSTG